MRRMLVVSAAVLAVSLPLWATAAEHAALQPDSLKWTAAPPAFPPGAQIAVLNGDPSKEGLYVLRLKVPSGYKVPAHTHPNDENVTVISGSFNIGMGDKLDQAKSPGGQGRRLRACAQGHAAFRLVRRGQRHPGARHGPVGDQLRQSRRRSAQGVHRAAMTSDQRGSRTISGTRDHPAMTEGLAAFSKRRSN